MCFLFSTISKLPNQNSTTKMLRHLLTILTSLSVCTAANLTSQIELIRNPPHHANYSPPYTPSPSDDPARLLIIGDVHGMLDQLEALLSKADYSSSRGDRVIFVGDLVNKGPKSSGVVQYAMDINATSSSSGKRHTDDYQKYMMGRCYGCGSKNHRKAEGRHERDICDYCGITGHLANVCRKKYFGQNVQKVKIASTSEIPEKSTPGMPDFGAIFEQLMNSQKAMAQQIENLTKGF